MMLRIAFVLCAIVSGTQASESLLSIQQLIKEGSPFDEIVGKLNKLKTDVEHQKKDAIKDHDNVFTVDSGRCSDYTFSQYEFLIREAKSFVAKGKAAIEANLAVISQSNGAIETNNNNVASCQQQIGKLEGFVQDEDLYNADALQAYNKLLQERRDAALLINNLISKIKSNPGLQQGAQGFLEEGTNARAELEAQVSAEAVSTLLTNPTLTEILLQEDVQAFLYANDIKVVYDLLYQMLDRVRNNTKIKQEESDRLTAYNQKRAALKGRIHTQRNKMLGHMRETADLGLKIALHEKKNLKERSDIDVVYNPQEKDTILKRDQGKEECRELATKHTSALKSFATQLSDVEAIRQKVTDVKGKLPQSAKNTVQHVSEGF